MRLFSIRAFGLGVGAFSLTAPIYAGSVIGGDSQIDSDCGDQDCENDRHGDGIPDRSGDVTITVAARFIPTQPELDEMAERMKLVNQMICDASENQVRLRKVNIVASDSAADSADIWWYRYGTLIGEDKVGYANALGRFGDKGARIIVSEGESDAGQANIATITHELGHTLFGLGESYERRWAKTTDDCGIGPMFDDTPVDGGMGWQRVPSSSPFFAAVSSRPEVMNTFVGNSIMDSTIGDQLGLCVTPEGVPPQLYDPLNWSETSKTCVIDVGCGGYGAFSRCGAFPVLQSELSTSRNLDELIGTFDSGMLSGDSDTSCPRPKAQEIVLWGKLRPNRLASLGTDADGDGSLADNNEECDFSAPPGSCPLDGFLGCGAGIIDETDCEVTSATANCGDGEIQGDENCDDGAAPTTPFRSPCSLEVTGDAASTSHAGEPLTGGFVRCSPNCRYDFSECTVRDPGVTIDQDYFVIGDNVASSEKFVFLDALGLEGPGFGNDSRHTLVVRSERTGDHEWVVAILAEEGTFEDGPAGLQFLASYKLTFGSGFSGPAGQLMRINDQNVNPNSKPLLILGDENLAWSGGTMDIGDLPNGQLSPTGNFVSGSESHIVEMDFTNLREEFWETPDGSTQYTDTFVKARARAGVVSGMTIDSGANYNQIVHNGKDIPVGRACGDTKECALTWNSQTNQHETSDVVLRQYNAKIRGGTTLAQIASAPLAGIRSEWELMREFLQGYNGGTIAECDDGNGLCKGPLLQLPSGPVTNGADPAYCQDPFFYIETAERPEEVVIALDRSGSMRADVGLASVGASRLDVAKAAGRVFMNTWGNTIANAAFSVDVGLLWFNDKVSQHPTDIDGLRRLTRDTTNDPDFIEIETLEGEMRDSQDDEGENPEPEGQTAIGAALDRAGEMLPGNQPGRAVLLLSDGKETVDPGSEEDALERLRGDGDNVRVYVVTAGADTDKKVSAYIAGETGGEVFDATDETEIPGTFFEFFARQRGQSLARHHSAPEEVKRTGGAPEFPVFSSVRKVTVEPGAKSLGVLVWTKNAHVRPIDEECNSTGGLSICVGGSPGYRPVVSLVNPNGDTVTPQMTEDAYYVYLYHPNPISGEWEVRERMSNSDLESPSWAAAFVDNPEVKCTADVSTRIVGEDRDIAITVNPIDVGTVGPGAEISVRLRRPDTSEVNLAVGYNDDTRLYEAKIPESSLIGRGIYQAVVVCDVNSGTQLLGTEIMGELPIEEMEEPRLSSGFVRETSVGFFLDVAEQPPLRPGGDCDRDGIPDAHEPEGDFDFDGVPNVCDSDADGDEVPDGIDDSITHVCEPDVLAPRIDPRNTVTVTTCNEDAHRIAFPAPHAEDFCSEVTVSGELIAVGSQTLAVSLALDDELSTLVRPGTATIRWVATDDSGNVTELDETIEIEHEVSTQCCVGGQTIIEGTAGIDQVVSGPGDYCVLTYEQADFVLTSSGEDLIFGGTGADHLNAGSGQRDILFGGDGADMVNCGYGGFAEIHAGAGSDHLQLVYCSGAELWGGVGDDHVIGSPGTDLIYPGPGRDSVAAGQGDDTVVIHHVCEATPGKVVDGGWGGHDTLITPVSLTQLGALGVVVSGFENIIVDPNRGHLAVCF